jgi:hypothetical protein
LESVTERRDGLALAEASANFLSSFEVEFSTGWGVIAYRVVNCLSPTISHQRSDVGHELDGTVALDGRRILRPVTPLVDCQQLCAEASCNALDDISIRHSARNDRAVGH